MARLILVSDGIPFEAPVIPPKAGIQLYHSVLPKVYGVDYRFRGNGRSVCGNDCDFERPCLTNDLGTRKRFPWKTGLLFSNIEGVRAGGDTTVLEPRALADPVVRR
jgi:hypothetical protein